MHLDRLRQTPWLTRIALITSIAAVVLVMFLYAQIDSIVNHDLYGFSLRFNSAWYSPYSFYTKLIYIVLAVPVVLCGVALGLSFGKEADKATETNVNLQQSGLRILDSEEVKPQQVVSSEKPKAKQQIGSNTCPNCDKTFTRPLVTLNFVNGKPAMVNTCPYCNEPVGTMKNEKKSEPDIKAEDSEKEEEAK
jgi:hypothetical protein